jgi:hypothetical protein
MMHYISLGCFQVFTAGDFFLKKKNPEPQVSHADYGFAA